MSIQEEKANSVTTTTWSLSLWCISQTFSEELGCTDSYTNSLTTCPLVLTYNATFAEIRENCILAVKSICDSQTIHCALC